MGNIASSSDPWMEAMARRSGRPESDMLKAFRLYLECRGCLVFRRNTGKIRIPVPGGKDRLFVASEPGQSDLWAIMPNGIHLEVEVKRPGGWPSKAQIEWMRMINTKTCAYALWSDTVERLDLLYTKIEAGGRVYVDANGDIYIEWGGGL